MRPVAFRALGLRRCRRPAALLLLCAVLTLALPGPALPAPERFDPGGSDPAAIRLADQVVEALGGDAAWASTRFLRFSFDVVAGGITSVHRVHLWDRHRGRLRYEKTAKDGSSMVVLLALESREGEAWRDGRRLDPKSAEPWLKEAYEAWINDTYWLLMPFKLKDPGVHLRMAGSEMIGGVREDRILLSFDQVGLTPGDRYWVSINRSTHRVDRWAYILQDDPPGTKPAVWSWQGWGRHGRILLASEKVGASEKGVTIAHPILQAPAEVPESVFLKPDPVPPLDDVPGPPPGR